VNESEAASVLASSRKKQAENFSKKSNVELLKNLTFQLDYESYRIAFRDVAASTNERSMIATVLPPKVLCPHTVSLEQVYEFRIEDETINPNYQLLSSLEKLFVCAVMNSFVIDAYLRRSITNHLSFFFVYATPIPRSQPGDRFFAEIVERAAKLICTTPEFNDLAQEVGIGSHQNGTTEECDRATLRAELDGMIAHLYHLTEAEFAHILSTFPIVPEATKQAAIEAYRTFAPPEGDAEIAALIAQSESTTIEFKSTARWNLNDNKKDPTMEQVILKTVAAFLNAQGGTLLIGVNDAGEAIGLAPDYRTLKSGKQNRDGFELWLMGDLLLKELGNDLAPAITISFHILNGQEICKVAVSPSSHEVFLTLKDKNGQSKKLFCIRAGNSTRILDDPSEMLGYIRDRWKT
jgi:Putative DNA-binding domain